MACALVKTGPRKFKAPVGSQVTLRLEGPANAGVSLLEIRYNALQRDSEPPFQFNVKEDLRPLVVVFSASAPNVRLTLFEVCGDGEDKKLDGWRYDPINDARAYFITGVRND
jgi:hypothetical protein